MSTSIQDVPHATPPAHGASASPVTIEPAEVDVMLKADAILLIDVRSSDEHRHERIPGAVCMPLDWLDPEAIERMGSRFAENVASYLVPVERVNAGVPKDIHH